jgi:hypothetical protein
VVKLNELGVFSGFSTVSYLHCSLAKTVKIQEYGGYPLRVQLFIPPNADFPWDLSNSCLR